MKKKKVLQFFLISFLAMFILSACGGTTVDGTPVIVIPPTPTFEMFPFPQPTPTFTQQVIVVVQPTPIPTNTQPVQFVTATPVTPTVVVILPETGADLTAEPVSISWFWPASLVVIGLSLVAFGLLRWRR